MKNQSPLHAQNVGCSFVSSTYEFLDRITIWCRGIHWRTGGWVVFHRKFPCACAFFLPFVSFLSKACMVGRAERYWCKPGTGRARHRRSYHGIYYLDIISKIVVTLGILGPFGCALQIPSIRVRTSSISTTPYQKYRQDRQREGIEVKRRGGGLRVAAVAAAMKQRRYCGARVGFKARQDDRTKPADHAAVVYGTQDQSRISVNGGVSSTSTIATSPVSTNLTYSQSKVSLLPTSCGVLPREAMGRTRQYSCRHPHLHTTAALRLLEFQSR